MWHEFFRWEMKKLWPSEDWEQIRTNQIQLESNACCREFFASHSRGEWNPITTTEAPKMTTDIMAGKRTMREADDRHCTTARRCMHHIGHACQVRVGRRGGLAPFSAQSTLMCQHINTFCKLSTVTPSAMWHTGQHWHGRLCGSHVSPKRWVCGCSNSNTRRCLGMPRVAGTLKLTGLTYVRSSKQLLKLSRSNKIRQMMSLIMRSNLRKM